MARLAVEVADRELQHLRAVARARKINPDHLTKAQLRRLLALQGNRKYRGRLLGVFARALSIRGQRGVHLRVGFKRAKNRGNGVAMPAQSDNGATNDAIAEQAERDKRLAAVMSMHGIWKDDSTKPQDGAEYQREIRAEWR